MPKRRRQVFIALGIVAVALFFGTRARAATVNGAPGVEKESPFAPLLAALSQPIGGQVGIDSDSPAETVALPPRVGTEEPTSPTPTTTEPTPTTTTTTTPLFGTGGGGSQFDQILK